MDQLVMMDVDSTGRVGLLRAPQNLRVIDGLIEGRTSWMFLSVGGKSGGLRNSIVGCELLLPNLNDDRLGCSEIRRSKCNTRRRDGNSGG